MAWEPDRRSNSFFSPPAHLCAVTYMTEISLIVTLNNHITNHYLIGQIGQSSTWTWTIKKNSVEEFALSILVFYVICNNISVIYVTSQMCRRTEKEVVPTVGLPPAIDISQGSLTCPSYNRHGTQPFHTVIPTHRPFSRLLRHAGDTEDVFST